MKVLLLQDVYNLGRAGDIKKVANGFGRNFLLPQNLAVLATPGAVTQSEIIRNSANQKRTILNEEMAGVAEKMTGLQLLFPARAGETGKLYGSVTNAMIADGISEKLGLEVSKRQIDTQPVRLLGMHMVKVRLTMDMIPEVTVVVYREGEAPENYMVLAEDLFQDISEEEEISPVEIVDEAAEETEDKATDDETLAEEATTEEETAEETSSEETDSDSAE
jgi:large subunit ribosomal protein L9